jgi:excisionase family DNA binding protein
MHERYRVDEATISLPGEWVVLVAEPPKSRRPPVIPTDLQAHIRCVGGVVTLDHPTATYIVALLDVCEKLAESRYGTRPKAPFGAVRDALNVAATRAASAVRPPGTCVDARDGDDEPKLVSENPVMSTKEAAEMLDVTTSGVTHLVRHGRLEATKFGNQWAINAASVAAYRAARTPRLKKGEVA